MKMEKVELKDIFDMMKDKFDLILHVTEPFSGKAGQDELVQCAAVGFLKGCQSCQDREQMIDNALQSAEAELLHFFGN